MEKRNTVFAGIAIAAGLIICGYLLGHSLQRFKKEDRYISVKGFSEKEIKSDFVIWTIKLRIASNDLQEGSKSIGNSKSKVNSFLVKNGIQSNEIISRDLFVNDRQANEYEPASGINNFRYIIEETIEVRSKNVDMIQKVSRMTGELLSAGVALSTKNDWSGTGIRFIYTRLNDIKPEMITEAIKNAQSAGIQFARESNTSLGVMRKASQGLFTIQDRDEVTTGQEGGGGYPQGTTDLFKKVRVVVNVDYSID
jgi:hypothetical protein